jgi:hypothetical protein
MSAREIPPGARPSEKARLPKSTQASKVRTARGVALAGTNADASVTRRRLRRGEFEFHQFVGFVGSSFPSPATNCIRGGLRQNGVPTLDVDRFHTAIGGNESFDLYDFLQRHAAREGWISGRHEIQESALGETGPAGARRLRRKQHPTGNRQQQHTEPGEATNGASFSRLLGVELDFSQLFSFMSRRLELPMSHGRHGALCKDRMSAHHVN